MTDTTGETTDEPTGPPEWLQYSVRFMDRVATVCDTSVGRADLRTGRTPGGLAEPWRMMPHLVGCIPRRQRDAETAHLAVAAMYAHQADNPRLTGAARPKSTYHPAHGNLGASLAAAVRRGILLEDNASERLQLLARQSTLDGLLRYLRPLVDRLAAEQVPLSWPRLVRDVDGWNRYRNDIARAWMRTFYSPVIDPETQEPRP